MCANSYIIADTRHRHLKAAARACRNVRRGKLIQTHGHVQVAAAARQMRHKLRPAVALEEWLDSVPMCNRKVGGEVRVTAGNRADDERPQRNGDLIRQGQVKRTLRKL